MAKPVPPFGVHIIRSADTSRWPSRITTYCGKKGMGSGWPNEYDTPEGHRFEAHEPGAGGWNQPTCKACIRYQ